MQRISFARKPINQLALHEALYDALGDSYIAFSINSRDIIIYLANEATNSERQQARVIVQQHDANQPSRREEAFAIRQERLDNTRRNQAPELDLAQFAPEPETVRALAEKVYWLELEIRTLTGQ